MANQAANGLHCGSCIGTCCTFIANSMQVTPVEAVDLLQHLVDTNRWNANTLATLETTTKRFRLDQPPPGDGRRSFSRRRYTCPFYDGSARGCTVSRNAKPYGCLAFNPRIPDQTEGGDCASQIEALTPLESPDLDEANQQLRDQLNLDWDKKPIPTALLDLASQFPPHPQEP